jgi:Nucleotide modification associated domain 3
MLISDMKGLLIRVGADKSDGGGRWNGPVKPETGEFVYVPIPETKPVHRGLEKPYTLISPALDALAETLPSHLTGQRMHLDPDFEHLTYGDRGSKGRQLSATLRCDDVLVFYAGLNAVASDTLVYAIIGLLQVERIVRASDQDNAHADCNAHTRRILTPESDDVIVVGKREGSGRLRRCIPIGAYRNKAYRVREELLEAWGGLSVNDGYVQRSAVFPELLDAAKFMSWWNDQTPELLRLNNPAT